MRKAALFCICSFFCITLAAQLPGVPAAELLGNEDGKFIMGIWSAALPDEPGIVRTDGSGKPLFRGFGPGVLRRITGNQSMVIPTPVPYPYDANGFDANGIHKDTGTRYDPNGYDKDGFNAEG